MYTCQILLKEPGLHEEPTEHNKDAAAHQHGLHSSQFAELRHSTVRVFFHPRAEGHAGTALVSSAVLHAALLHELQHQLPAVRHVRHHVPSLPGAAPAEGPQEHDEVPLQSAEVHLASVAEILEGQDGDRHDDDDEGPDRPVRTSRSFDSSRIHPPPHPIILRSSPFQLPRAKVYKRKFIRESEM